MKSGSEQGGGGGGTKTVMKYRNPPKGESGRNVKMARHSELREGSRKVVEVGSPLPEPPKLRNPVGYSYSLGTIFGVWRCSPLVLTGITVGVL